MEEGESKETYLQSTSFPETISVIIKRTQGGGVMGRRSCIVLTCVKLGIVKESLDYKMRWGFGALTAMAKGEYKEGMER